MLFTLEATGALFYRAISEQRLDPPVESIQRARAAHVQVQRAVVELIREAIRICGGRAMLKRYPLERYYRGARASAACGLGLRRRPPKTPGKRSCEADEGEIDPLIGRNTAISRRLKHRRL